MGLFDTLIDNELLCVYCQQPVTEIQTKDLENTMTEYYIPTTQENLDQALDLKKYAKTSPKLRYIEATAICNNETCYATQRMQDYLQRDYISGFGRTFHIQYPVDTNGNVNQPSKITDKDNYQYETTKKQFLEKLQQNPTKNTRFHKHAMKYRTFQEAVNTYQTKL